MRSGEVRTILKHVVEEVNWLSFSPDGTQIATKSIDGIVQMWRNVCGESRVIFTNNIGKILSLAFSLTGTLLALISKNGHNLQILDVISLKAKAIIQDPQSIGGRLSRSVFSQDCTLIASRFWDGTVRVRNTISGEEWMTLHQCTKLNIDSLTMSYNNELIAAGYWNGIAVWDCTTGNARLKFQFAFVTTITFSRTSNLLAANIENHQVSNLRRGVRKCAKYSPG